MSESANVRDGSPECEGPQIHYLLADASGDAALVEFYEGELLVCRVDGKWHLATNHYRAPLVSGEGSGCWRYDQLDAELAAADGRLSAGDAMALLAQVAQASTQWSAVYDMVDLTVSVAMGQDYRHLSRFRLAED